MTHLNDKGREIYDRLEKHVRGKLKMFDIDSIELSMLANSYALYFEMAEYCNENEVKFVMTTEKGGSYEQIRPEYTVMKNEYQNILKHSAKFGLTPGDRSRIFKELANKKEKKKVNEGID
jgi:P27 family predicted phage terminase small subunit